METPVASDKSLRRDFASAFSIEAKNLVKIYGKNSPAVKDLSFQIRPGESVAFLGPNGAGKSTTIKMLCGILSPNSGEAMLAGFRAGSREGAKRIGLVFGTRSQLFMHMTVAQCLEISAEIYFLTGAQKIARIRELTTLFELEKLLNARVRSLSLGQRMRCEIAAALLHRPQILLADEPTIGLDIIAKTKLRELIRRWQADEKTTLLLTSHDLSDVEALCDRCILIDHGVKMFDGPIEDMKGEWKNIRRITIRAKTAEASARQAAHPELRALTKTSTTDEYSNVYENDIRRFPMAQALSTLTQHYGEELADIEISPVTLEEIIAGLYRKPNPSGPSEMKR